MLSVLDLVLVLGLYLLLCGTVLRLSRCKSSAKLHGKTAVVTGANTGIGKTTALDLARRGARVILACRDQGRAEAAVTDIIKETGNTQVVFMHLDLSSLKSVRSFVENFLNSESRLDLLVNNAGLWSGGRTADGFGMIFGVNHLGHFLLTVLLLDHLKASGRSRVVTVASRAYEFGALDFSCLMTHRDVSLGDGELRLLQKYATSKLCNILFTHELSNRLKESTVSCYVLHPGFIKTDIGRYTRWWWKVLLWPVIALFAADADSGAQTTLHCALEPGIENLSGHYFSNCRVQNLKPHARDDGAARKLWEVSERFCGLE